jgi:hypothetical protein
VIKPRKKHPGQKEPPMVFPSEHPIESTHPTEPTTTTPHALRSVMEQVTREMQAVARRRGWVPTAQPEPSTAGTPYPLFCGALSEDLARRLVAGHQRPSADTPAQTPTLPIPTPQESPPSPNTTALDELWQLADQLSAAVHAHLDQREQPSHQKPTPHPHPDPPEDDR